MSNQPIVEVTLTPTHRALWLEFGLAIREGRWLLEEKTLEIRVYIADFPSGIGRPELPNMSLDERSTTSTVQASAGLNATIANLLPVQVSVTGGKEKTRTDLTRLPDGADPEGRYLAVKLTLSEKDVRGNVTYPRLRWPMPEGWLRTPRHVQVLFGYPRANDDDMKQVLATAVETLKPDDLPPVDTPFVQLEHLMTRLIDVMESQQPNTQITVGDIENSTGILIGVDSSMDVRQFNPYTVPESQAKLIVEVQDLKTRVDEIEQKMIVGLSKADEETLHKRYLKQFFKPDFMNVSIAEQVTPTADGDETDFEKNPIRLVDIYVPLPVDMSVTIVVSEEDKRTITDWWVKHEESGTEADRATPEELRDQRLHEWPALQIDRERMDILIAYVQKKLNERDVPDDKDFWAEQNWYMEAHDAAALQPRMALTGNPGSGKSTFMKHMAICMAGELLGDDPAAGGVGIADLKDWHLKEAFTPVFIRLAELVQSQFPKVDDKADVPQFDAYIRAELQEADLTQFWPTLKRKLEAGEVIILLDGLDEVPGAVAEERRKQIQTFVENLETEYGRCRMIVTSRPHAYNTTWGLKTHIEDNKRPFGQAALIPLFPNEVYRLALNLFSHVIDDAEKAKKEAEDFYWAVDAVRKLRKENETITNTPLLFTMMAALWLRQPDPEKGQKKTLPTKLSELYRQCVDLMLTVWTKKDREGGSVASRLGLSSQELRGALEYTAFHALKSNTDDNDEELAGNSLFFKWSLLVEGIMAAQATRSIPQNPQATLDFLTQRASLLERKAALLTSEAPQVYKFTHLSFQEHLAACYLADETRYPAEIISRMREQPGRWTNVVKLLVDEIDSHREQDLLPGLLAMPPEADLPLDHGQWGAVELAHTLVEERNTALHEPLKPDYKRWLEAVIKTGALEPPSRASVARALAELGDPRPGVGLGDDGLPAIDWVEIPAGDFYYQGGEKRPEEAFYIARYPVTWQQYQSFVEADDGYQNTDWWGYSDEAQQWRTENPQPRDARWAIANHPREQVSWYEAVAFCRWLSAKRGKTITLPTEWQWEKAARGGIVLPDGKENPEPKRDYPYEGDFDAAKGNTSVTGIGQTSAVGIFPQGVSPYGIQDMSGNVWEWCLNEYREPENIALGGDARRVVRGGTFYYDQGYARVSYRSLRYPGDWSYYQGFRLVLLPSD